MEDAQSRRHTRMRAAARLRARSEVDGATPHVLSVRLRPDGKEVPFRPMRAEEVRLLWQCLRLAVDPAARARAWGGGKVYHK